MRRFWAGIGATAAAALLIGCGGGGGGTATTGSTDTGGTTSGRAKWNVLVFMNASNDLTDYDTLNLNQMEQVAGNPDVRFLVQWKQSSGWWDPSPNFLGTRRYLVRPDGSDAIASTLVQDLGQGVDMGTPGAVADFVNWAKATYPADRTVLILWDHGTGWRRSGREAPKTRNISVDMQTGSVIQAWQLQAAVPGKVDILATDACLMQMAEVAHELKDKAEFIVGSEEETPAEGYPYHLIFNAFRDRPTDTTENLARAFVTGMTTYPRYQTWPITQSSVRTDKMDELATALDAFAGALIANRDAVAPAVRSARNDAQSYDFDGSHAYRDLKHLATLIRGRTDLADVKTAADGVIAAVDAAVSANGRGSRSPNSNGLAIDFTEGNVFANTFRKGDYAKLTLGQATRWDEWLSVAP